MAIVLRSYVMCLCQAASIRHSATAPYPHVIGNRSVENGYSLNLLLSSQVHTASQISNVSRHALGNSITGLPTPLPPPALHHLPLTGLLWTFTLTTPPPRGPAENLRAAPEAIDGSLQHAKVGVVIARPGDGLRQSTTDQPVSTIEGGRA